MGAICVASGSWWLRGVGLMNLLAFSVVQACDFRLCLLSILTLFADWIWLFYVIINLFFVLRVMGMDLD